jgi:hypothetical protein
MADLVRDTSERIVAAKDAEHIKYRRRRCSSCQYRA